MKMSKVSGDVLKSKFLRRPDEGLQFSIPELQPYFRSPHDIERDPKTVASETAASSANSVSEAQVEYPEFPCLSDGYESVECGPFESSAVVPSSSESDAGMHGFSSESSSSSEDSSCEGDLLGHV